MNHIIFDSYTIKNDMPLLENFAKKLRRKILNLYFVGVIRQSAEVRLFGTQIAI